MIKLIKNIIFNYRLRSAIRQANDMAQLTGLRHFVILLDGNLKVVSKRRLKQLIDTRRFIKGAKISDFERRALHITK